MHEITAGKRTLGHLPRVVGVITTSAGLAQAASSPEDPGCDLIEVRLGEVDVSGNRWLNECIALEARGTPVLITIREQSEGGTWPDEDPGRMELFERALEECSIVDIELHSLCFYRVLECATAHKKPVIISTHHFEETPTREALDAFQDRVASLDNVILKIAAVTRNEDDVATLQDFLVTPHPCPVCVLGMGASGVETRIRFPELGSCLTYGYLDAPSAPGQHACEELVATLRKRVPEYDADLRLRGIV
ncbi:MAG: 3-dehydroquinate dehydratase-1 [Kiritimatiellia bacterium]|jgi:3-dehydroquinate dehydratase I